MARDITNVVDIRDLVSGVSKLASLPEVCVRVNEMVDDPRSSAADIGKVISRDTALSAQLLRIANSAFFSFPSKVGTVTRAITVIGERELRYLVLALSAVRSFNNIPIELSNMASFWRHSVYTGVVAKLLAERCHVLHGERLFVAGLLHDIGLLILMNRLPDIASEALRTAAEGEMTLSDAERDLLGFDHAQVGGALLYSWNLPQVLCDTVAYHHNISLAEEVRLDTSIIHLANVVANQAEVSLDYVPSHKDFDPLALKVCGLEPESLADIPEEAGPMFAESWALIQPMVQHG